MAGDERGTDGRRKWELCTERDREREREGAREPSRARILIADCMMAAEQRQSNCSITFDGGEKFKSVSGDHNRSLTSD